MKDTAQTPLINHILSHRHRRDAAVVERDQIGDTGSLHRFSHLQSLSRIERQRFFADDHLAGFSRSDGNFGVKIVGHADLNDIDLFVLNHLAPVSGPGLIAPALSKGPGLLLIQSADRLQDRGVLQIKKIADSAVGI